MTLYESMKEGETSQDNLPVILFAPTKERVEAAAMAARNIWRESRFELMEDKFVALPMFQLPAILYRPRCSARPIPLQNHDN
ncbi:hypothetical protein PCI56_05625 [Plesiomonas shigelloides subsp. oncorhynchi]|nr:hypothetical protein [Plesiomonas shigelloides]